MDVNSRNNLIFIGLLLSSPVWGTTVLTYPPTSSPLNRGEEVFPESRFGSEPIRRRINLEPSYTSSDSRDRTAGAAKDESDGQLTATEPRDGSDGAGYGRGRSPAGLVLESENKDLPQRPLPKFSKLVQDGVDAPPESGDVAKSEISTMVAGKKGVQEVALIANDLGYFPKTLFVTPDIPVRLYVTGASRSTLCIMMDSFQIRKQVRANKVEEIVFTPSQPGKFRFYCPVNGMEGTLIVRELASKVSE